MHKNSIFFRYRGDSFGSRFLSRQAYQDAVNHVFEKRNDYCFRNYQVLRVFIKHNGITRNNIVANTLFYRVVRVIPQKYHV